MITVEEKETIRRAHLVEGKSIRQIQREMGYQPGEMAQVDFGEAQVVIGGQQVTAHLFCLRLCYSKQPFVLALPTQRIGTPVMPIWRRSVKPNRHVKYGA